MVVRPLYSNRQVLAVMVVGLVASLIPDGAHAQDDLAEACAAASSAECYVAAAAVRTIHPRVGMALWGGSPVPGTASTHGMRLGSVPRVSGSTRIVVLPMELPPLQNRTSDEAVGVMMGGLSTQMSVGILQGLSPLPTVGGLFSLDAVARGSWLLLPDNQGFDTGNVFGGSVGLRLGILRESFTLPALSVTGSYGLSTGFAFGDPEGTGDGYIDGNLSTLSLSAGTTKRVGPVSLTAGASLDRYMTDVDFSYRGGPLEAQSAGATMDRWSLFGNVSWTFLILHGSLEAGWQEAPTPDGLPTGVSVDPAGWWAGAAVRLSS